MGNSLEKLKITHDVVLLVAAAIFCYFCNGYSRLRYSKM